MTLVERIVELHQRLDSHGIAHGFGGALALAWCTQQARGTIDIDCNLFVGTQDVARVIQALPEGVTVSDDDVARLSRDGQVRLYWGVVPLDLFMNTTPFHEEVAGRIRYERFGGTEVPFLSCTDLAVFKAFFDRPKDWVDLAEMATMQTFDADLVVGTLVRYLGPSDQRVSRLTDLTA